MSFMAALTSLNWTLVLALSVGIALFVMAAARWANRLNASGATPRSSALEYVGAAAASVIVVVASYLAFQTRGVNSLGAAIMLGVLLAVVPASTSFGAAAARGALRIGLFRVAVQVLVFVGTTAAIYAFSR